MKYQNITALQCRYSFSPCSLIDRSSSSTWPRATHPEDPWWIRRWKRKNFVRRNFGGALGGWGADRKKLPSGSSQRDQYVWDKIRSNCSVLHVPKPLAPIQRYLRLSLNILHIHDSFPGCFRVINIDIIY